MTFFAFNNNNNNNIIMSQIVFFIYLLNQNEKENTFHPYIYIYTKYLAFEINN